MATTLTRDDLALALARVAEGDRAAFRQVYQATSAKLFGVCLRILRDRQIAEDVLQDVYVTVWSRAAGFDAARASPITWLATIARNRAIDRLRQARPLRDAAPVEVLAEVADGGPGPEAAVVGAGERRRLESCLDQLEDRAAAAIRTAFFDGVTYDALAARAGVPIGTMKSWIRRGLQRLKTCLEP